jgi:hypothetical protein
MLIPNSLKCAQKCVPEKVIDKKHKKTAKSEKITIFTWTLPITLFWNITACPFQRI